MKLCDLYELPRRKRVIRCEWESTFILKKDVPELPEGTYLATIGVISEVSHTSKYAVVRIPLRILGTEKILDFCVQNRFRYNDVVWRLVEQVMGEPPKDGFDLKTIEGKQLKFALSYQIDDTGNLYEVIVPIKGRKVR